MKGSKLYNTNPVVNQWEQDNYACLMAKKIKQARSTVVAQAGSKKKPDTQGEAHSHSQHKANCSRNQANSGAGAAEAACDTLAQLQALLQMPLLQQLQQQHCIILSTVTESGLAPAACAPPTTAAGLTELAESSPICIEHSNVLQLALLRQQEQQQQQHCMIPAGNAAIPPAAHPQSFSPVSTPEPGAAPSPELCVGSTRCAAGACTLITSEQLIQIVQAATALLQSTYANSAAVQQPGLGSSGGVGGQTRLASSSGLCNGQVGSRGSSRAGKSNSSGAGPNRQLSQGRGASVKQHDKSKPAWNNHWWEASQNNSSRGSNGTAASPAAAVVNTKDSEKKKHQRQQPGQQREAWRRPAAGRMQAQQGEAQAATVSSILQGTTVLCDICGPTGTGPIACQERKRRRRRRSSSIATKGTAHAVAAAAMRAQSSPGRSGTRPGAGPAAAAATAAKLKSTSAPWCLAPSRGDASLHDVAGTCNSCMLVNEALKPTSAAVAADALQATSPGALAVFAQQRPTAAVVSGAASFAAVSSCSQAAARYLGSEDASAVAAAADVHCMSLRPEGCAVKTHKLSRRASSGRSDGTWGDTVPAQRPHQLLLKDLSSCNNSLQGGDVQAPVEATAKHAAPADVDLFATSLAVLTSSIQHTVRDLSLQQQVQQVQQQQCPTDSALVSVPSEVHLLGCSMQLQPSELLVMPGAGNTLGMADIVFLDRGGQAVSTDTLLPPLTPSVSMQNGRGCVTEGMHFQLLQQLSSEAVALNAAAHQCTPFTCQRQSQAGVRRLTGCSCSAGLPVAIPLEEDDSVLIGTLQGSASLMSVCQQAQAAAAAHSTTAAVPGCKAAPGEDSAVSVQRRMVVQDWQPANDGIRQTDDGVQVFEVHEYGPASSESSEYADEQYELEGHHSGQVGYAVGNGTGREECAQGDWEQPSEATHHSQQQHRGEVLRTHTLGKGFEVTDGECHQSLDPQHQAQQLAHGLQQLQLFLEASATWRGT